MVDNQGSPAYRYTMDHHNDPLASYFTNWGESRNHWHRLGNDAITATAHNEGYVQFWDWTRGGKCINRYQPEKNNFSGGFKFIKLGQETWNTLYCSSGFEIFERSFGMRYVEKKTLRNNLQIRERLYVPYGKDPVIISETEITNLNDTPVEISVYEYWDVNLYELLLAPITTAPLGELFDALRWRFNTRFQVTTAFDDEQQVLSASITLKPGKTPPPEEDISIEDYYSVITFLAPITDTPTTYYTDQQAFWGSGLPDNPDALQFEAPSNLLAPDSPDIGKACLIFRRDLRLEAYEAFSTAYIYGYSSAEMIPALLSTYRDSPQHHFENTMSSWSRVEARFVVPEVPWLTRETLWHGYYLMSGAFYEDYFSSHIINQGSAYGYNQGINGAHRDFALFCLPIAYLRPDLAREILGYTMKSQDGQTGKIPYGHQGYGFTSGYIIHGASSDLDLFFMLAMAEYLGATRDFDFLDVVLPYAPILPAALQYGGRSCMASPV